MKSLKSQEQNDAFNSTKIQKKYQITTIPDEKKAKKYIFAEFGSQAGQAIKNYGRDDQR
jgi:hypothetical protein